MKYATLSHNTMPVYLEQILVEITKSLEKDARPRIRLYLEKGGAIGKRNGEKRHLRLGKWLKIYH
jgi:hypothetical protein